MCLAHNILVLWWPLCYITSLVGIERIWHQKEIVKYLIVKALFYFCNVLKFYWGIV